MHIRKNRREREVVYEYMNNGWEVLTKGWPDLLCYKNGKVKMIEVKRKLEPPTIKMGLSKHQRRVIEILRGMGIIVEIRYIE